MESTNDHQTVNIKDIKSVGVIGLGYVGLPLAVAFSEVDIKTIGFDVDESKVNSLISGNSYIDDVSSQSLAKQVNKGTFLASSNIQDLATVDAVFICVPTPFDKAKSPDLTHVVSASESLKSILKRGMLVVLQSTTYPGTTVEIVQPILEETGLLAGKDFNLAFSPERVDPGNKNWNVRNTPKVVGGLTSFCTERARALLEIIMEPPGYVTAVSSPDAAEMAKLLENTYRAVNIALVNELAMLAFELKINIWEVIEAASTKPFGFQKFLPGIGPGGHCIPIDPHYLAWKAREHDFQTQFIEVAATINSGMAPYVVSRIQALLNERDKTLKNARILCCGAAFKSGVSDTRHSRAIRVMEILDSYGANISFLDPLVSQIKLNEKNLTSLDETTINWGEFDMIVVLVANDAWNIHTAAEDGILIFDAVNSLGMERENIFSL